MNILIVDDNPENRYLLESLLRGNGHEVQSAENGIDAINQLTAGHVELIISDILMPVMDGFQFCRKVKTDETLRGIPFIIYTATYTGPQDEAFAIKIGADRFIQKPCEPDAFMKAVDDVMAVKNLQNRVSFPEPAKEEEVLKLYSERLVRKLEKKMLELEQEIKMRQKAEESLRVKERKYRLLTDNTLDVIWAMSPDLEFTYINPAICCFTGHTPEEWVGSRLSDHCNEDTFSKIKQAIADEIAKGHESTGIILEAELIKKNREPIQIEIHGKVVYDDKGMPTSLQGTWRDISDRKRSEIILRESQEKYKSILDNIEEGYYEVDLSGNLTFFNQSACRILGYESTELMGMNHRDFMDPETARKVFLTFNRIFTTGEPARTVDWEVTTKEGNKCHLDTSVSLVKDARGKVIGFRGMARDITAHRESEKEKVLLTEQLRHAQKMESIGRLAGGIAHDFNNMLTIIIGHTELAKIKAEKGNFLLEDLAQIQHAADCSADLTKQLLTFARKQTISPQVLNINQTVEKTLKMLNRLIGEDIDLQWSPGKNLWSIKMDPSQVNQILANLCVNARDAIAGIGKIIIESKNKIIDTYYCRTHLDAVPGEYVLLSVSDNGCGMDKEIQSHIFEPFFTTKEIGKGTGLGLATIFGIVKQNKGFINVYSELNKGTTFTIYLPRYLGEKTISTNEDLCISNMRGNETILIVEDNPSILKMTEFMLEMQGYTVHSASTPNEAVRIAEALSETINLVITDVVMPDMNGKDLIQTLTSINPNIKSLFMSGYTADVIAHHNVLDPGVHFLQKPFTMKILAAKVREVLDKTDK